MKQHNFDKKRKIKTQRMADHKKDWVEVEINDRKCLLEKDIITKNVKIWRTFKHENITYIIEDSMENHLWSLFHGLYK